MSTVATFKRSVSCAERIPLDMRAAAKRERSENFMVSW
jgi:hypothetical protein